MIFALRSVILGLGTLSFAGDGLAKGAVTLALRLGLRILVISLTVVAFGTSAPELLVSVPSILDGGLGLALGNVGGSNAANVLLVVGISALIATLHIPCHETRRDSHYMLGATVLFMGLCLTGTLVWWHELILLAALATVLAATLLSSRDADVAVEGAEPGLPGWKLIVFPIVGLIGLPLGAIGTLLPALATTVKTTIRHRSDVALINVIGSDHFNLPGIIRVAVLSARSRWGGPFRCSTSGSRSGPRCFWSPSWSSARTLREAGVMALVGLYASYLTWVLT